MSPSAVAETAIQMTHHKWVHTPWINLWNDFKCFKYFMGDGEYKSNTYKLLLQSHVIVFNHMWLITRKTTIFTTVQTVYQNALLWNVLQTVLLSKLTYRLWFKQMLLILELFYFTYAFKLFYRSTSSRSPLDTIFMLQMFYENLLMFYIFNCMPIYV